MVARKHADDAGWANPSLTLFHLLLEIKDALLVHTIQSRTRAIVERQKGKSEQIKADI